MPVGVYIRKVKRKFSDESRKRMSEAAKKRDNNYWLGKKRVMPDGWREKISAANKGRVSPRKGKKFPNQISEETRIKMSEAHKGKKPYEMTDQIRENMRKVRLKGDKNPRWKGGIKNRIMWDRRRKIMKIKNGGSHTFGEWENLKIQYNLTCPCCKKKEPEIKLSLDHIIPVKRGGSDNIENIQPLCRSCNCKKSAKLIPKYIL